MQLDFDYHKQQMKVPKWFAQWFNSLDNEVNGVQRYTYAISKVVYNETLPWHACITSIRALDHEDTFSFKDTNKKAEQYFQHHKGYLLEALINRSLLNDFNTSELPISTTAKHKLLSIVQEYRDPHSFIGAILLVVDVRWGDSEYVVQDMNESDAHIFKKDVKNYFMACMAYL